MLRKYVLCKFHKKLPHSVFSSTYKFPFNYYRPSFWQYRYHAIYHCILAFFVRTAIISAFLLTFVYCIANHIVASSLARLIFMRGRRVSSPFPSCFLAFSFCLSVSYAFLFFLVQVALPSSFFLVRWFSPRYFLVQVEYLFVVVVLSFHSYKLLIFLILFSFLCSFHFFCVLKSNVIYKSNVILR